MHYCHFETVDRDESLVLRVLLVTKTLRCGGGLVSRPSIGLAAPKCSSPSRLATFFRGADDHRAKVTSEVGSSPTQSRHPDGVRPPAGICLFCKHVGPEQDGWDFEMHASPQSTSVGKPLEIQNHHSEFRYYSQCRLDIILCHRCALPCHFNHILTLLQYHRI